MVILAHPFVLIVCVNNGAVMIQDVEAELFADADPFQANDDAPAANHRDEDDGGELNVENPDDDGVDENAQATKRKRSLKPRPKLDVDRY